jgi:hypothetical protein
MQGRGGPGGRGPGGPGGAPGFQPAPAAPGVGGISTGGLQGLQNLQQLQGQGRPGGEGRPGGRGGPGRGEGGPGAGFGGFAGFSAFGGALDVDSTPIKAYAIVEVKRTDLKISQQGGYISFPHHWGKAKVLLPILDHTVEIDSYPPLLEASGKYSTALEPLAETYARRWKEIGKQDPPSKEQILELANWGLEHGFLEDAAKTATSPAVEGIPALIKELDRVDPKHPVAVAFKKVKEQIDKPAQQDAPLPVWAKNLPLKLMKSDHYNLYWDLPVEKDAKRRLDRLEKAYKRFYYWFALQGIAVPVPKERLVVVLLGDAKTFERYRKDVFDGANLMDDGFYCRDDNCIVMVGTRLDPVYDSLVNMTHSLMTGQGLTFDQLLEGRIKRADLLWYRGQTYALAQKFMEDESERSTTGYFATRQLLSAIGLAPRSVEVPQWAAFAVPSFFSTPKESFWPGVANTSSPYFVNFKKWQEALDVRESGAGETMGRPATELEKNSLEALKSVVTDRYFRLIGNGPDTDPNKVKAATKARTMAWSLGFFLAKKRLDNLRRYFEELQNVPRDLELDEDSLLLVFARAFDLARNNEVDENGLATLADTWYQFMRQTPREVSGLHKDEEMNRRGGPRNLRTAPGQQPPQGGPQGEGPSP